MFQYNILLLCIFLVSACRVDIDFPKDFIFGTGTSAYQVEGAWNVSGKGMSVWDHTTHYTDEIQDGSNGDIACNSYYKIKEDVQLLRDLGVQSYRFSLSWPRILPDGTSNKVNPDGIRYYNELLNELIAYNITPMVTLYHWDLPYELSLLGGWTNSVIVQYFVDFARIAFENFGDRVPLWITFNEPQTFCSFYDGVTNAVYFCSHNVLKAHAKTFHLYKKDFAHQKGKMGISLQTPMSYPYSDNPEDIAAKERSYEFVFNAFAHPIYTKTGDYSTYYRNYLDEVSKLENYAVSKLPKFTKTEIKEISGTFDFLGLNHYNAYRIARGNYSEKDKPSINKDKNYVFLRDPSWPPSETNFGHYPQGLYELLLFLNENYKDIPIYITESGFAETAFNDQGRLRYYKEYLEIVAEAIKDGVNVLGYYAWSFLDSFEWIWGYKHKFGLYYVDFTDPERPRTPKPSAIWYSNLIKYHRNRYSSGNNQCYINQKEFINRYL